MMLQHQTWHWSQTHDPGLYYGFGWMSIVIQAHFLVGNTRVHQKLITLHDQIHNTHKYMQQLACNIFTLSASATLDKMARVILDILL